MGLDNDDLNVLDELALTVQSTLAHYRILMREGRYTDARECLAMTEELTNQIHSIEDHMESTTISYTPTDMGKLVEVGRVVHAAH